MAVLLLISRHNVNEPHQYENDVVGVFDDDWPFTDWERQRFGFLTLKGGRAEIEKRLRELLPPERTVYRHSDGVWRFNPPLDARDRVEKKEAWQDPADSRWKFLENPRKFKWNTSQLTETEKTALETFDISTSTDLTAQAAAQKTVRLHSEKQNNDVVVPDVNIGTISG